nr:sodium pump decarboxylase [Veillonella denticariosi]
MEIVHLVDPTKKKKTPVESSTPVAAFAASVASAPVQNDDEVVAAIVGAIVAMGGYSSEQIASIRPTATSAKWRMEGRLSGRN